MRDLFRNLGRLCCLAALATVALTATAEETLQNPRIRAEFGPRGLVSLQSKETHETIRFASEDWSIAVRVNGVETRLDRAMCGKANVTTTATERRSRYRCGPWSVQEVFELKREWGFLSKQLFLERGDGVDFHILQLQPFLAQVTSPSFVEERRFREGAFLRLRSGVNSSGSSAYILLQNPFLQWERQGEHIAMAYKVAMDWKPAWGVFTSDRVCIGMTRLSGIRYPAAMIPEWKFVAEPAQPSVPSVDRAEVEAVTDCARAFLLVHPQKSIRAHIGWCDNDYQIDIATKKGRDEYKRIIDRAAEMGCQHLLFTPANGELAKLEENRDAWGWENVLWLTLGQKIRKGEWSPEKDPIPASIQEMLDYAKSRHIRLLAYIYPSMPFMQNPEWTKWIKNQQPGGYLGADTGIRSFQDWLVDRLVAFHQKTGISGFSFDHWWIAYDDASSKYAQWYGCRRILEELRRRIPDVLIDGRQQYHQFGVWTWLAGTYPHPLGTDEQPQSFAAFPDLHFDRVTADRQRYMAYIYRVRLFTPTEILPGFIGHQTTRSDSQNVLRRDTFRPRDWDVLGWKYSLISSIATAPFHHVINLLPARDTGEYAHFAKGDQAWFRSWLDWTDRNLSVLRHVRPILGQPAVGKVDGTAAFEGPHGFVFLFNPNYRALKADFVLDETIGLHADAAGKHGFTLNLLFPDMEKGKRIGNASHPLWHYGDRVSLPISGTQAYVLEVNPAPDVVTQPELFNAIGKASFKDGQLDLTGIAGQSGSTSEIQVLLPAGQRPKTVAIQGVRVAFHQTADSLGIPMHFSGNPFRHSQQIGTYDPAFAGGSFSGTQSVPGRVFRQLVVRKKGWPIAYTEDDLKATWLGPDRLLLFVNVAEPIDTMKVTLKVDGQSVPLLPAYTSVYPQATERTFVGWYADVSSLRPDVSHTFAVELPALRPGQFQGLFFDNVEDELTTVLR